MLHPVSQATRCAYSGLTLKPFFCRSFIQGPKRIPVISWSVDQRFSSLSTRVMSSIVIVASSLYGGVEPSVGSVRFDRPHDANGPDGSGPCLGTPGAGCPR